MSDIKTSVKLGGDAAGLKAAAADAKLAIKQLKEETNSSAPTVKDFFHDMHAGALSATGSMRGLGQAFSVTEGMIPIVAAGILFETLKKFDVFKNMFSDISDAIGLSSKSFDEEKEAIKSNSDALLDNIKYEHDLATARGETHDQTLRYTIAENKEIIAKANERVDELAKELEKEEELLYRSGKVTSKAEFEAYRTSKEIQGSKYAEINQMIIDQMNIALNASKAISIASADNNTKDLKDYQKAADEKLKIEIKLQADLDKLNTYWRKERQKSEEDSTKVAEANTAHYYKWMIATTTDAFKKIDDSTKKHDDTMQKIFDRLSKEARTYQGALNGVGEAFGDMAAGAKDSGKEMIYAVLDGGQRVIDMYLAEAIAAQIAKDAAIPFGLIAAGAGVAALVAMFHSLVPAFADGTNNAPGGLSLVGEHGAELVNLPTGSQVYTNSQTQGMLGGGGGTVIFEIEGSKLVGVLNNHNRRTQSYR